MNFDFDEINSNINRRVFAVVGNGSGRRVYDLGNGYVAKAAKNKKGIAQNQAEYNMALNTDIDIFAKIIDASEDFRYVIMEKAKRVPRIGYVWKYYNVKNSRELFKNGDLKDISTKFGLAAADLARASNWGMINGVPVIVDYGLTDKVFKKYYLNDRIKSLFLLFLGL